MKVRQYFAIFVFWIFSAVAVIYWFNRSLMPAYCNSELLALVEKIQRLNLSSQFPEASTFTQNCRITYLPSKLLRGTSKFNSTLKSTSTSTLTKTLTSTKTPSVVLKVYHTGKYTVNMTVVTAFFDLGTFQKGAGGAKFTTSTYHKWSAVFQYMRNPLVVYTDSVPFQTMMQNLRQNQTNLTRIIFVKRQELWSFAIMDKIKKVYSIPGYPQHFPNTVKPEYSSSQHSKYAVVSEAIRRDYFGTEFYCWFDIGYFRDIVNKKKDFVLIAPKDLNRTKVGMNRVYGVSFDTPVKNIFHHNIVWVGGGMFIGTRETLLKFGSEYKKAVMFFLDKNLMNTDQQVVFAMFSKEGRKDLKLETELQLYIPVGPGNPWFYLGYLCYKEL